MTSLPANDCGLPNELTCSAAPVSRSISSMATVVVPTSTARPSMRPW